MRIKPSILFSLFAVVLVVVLRLTEGQQRYTFGHAHALYLAIKSFLYVLGATHVVIATILWFHRRNWLPSESATFMFVSVKAVFWTSQATTFALPPGGIRLDIVGLFILLVVSTLWLDYTLFQRYLRGAEDASFFGKPDDVLVSETPGERRSGFDRRRGWGRLS